MKAKQITFDDTGEALESVSVTMSARELYLIATALGGMTPSDKNLIASWADGTGSEIYECLERVANMLYEDGLNDMIDSI